MHFVHLHLHSHYSLLDGMISIRQLFEHAEREGIQAVAITDKANLSAVPEIVKEAARHPGVKPIYGCELPVSSPRDGHARPVVLLAKTLTGFRNLMTLVSMANVGGGSPSVCREVVGWFHEGLVCLSGSADGEVMRAILDGDLPGAEETARWYGSVFGDDYYLEVTPLGPDAPSARETFRLGEKLGIKTVATNDVRFVHREDAAGYRLLTSLDRSRNGRPVPGEAYMKTGDEMLAAFPGHPEAVGNTLEVAGKIGTFDIRRQPELPAFPLSEAQRSLVHRRMRTYARILDAGARDEEGMLRGDRFFESMSLLCHLAFTGATRRYGSRLPGRVREGLRDELKAISAANLPDLFLICHDIVTWARGNGVLVGPGRGSAPGSLVVYCLGITEVDPLRYGLLPERFMNPGSGSIPYLAIDLDERGRSRVIEHLADKYGDGHVALETAFGVLPPDHPGFDERLKGVICRKGVNICTVLLGDRELTEYVPLGVCTAKDGGRRFLLSQYPTGFAQRAGAIQLDLLGCRALSVVKECLARVKSRHGLDIRLEDIPLDDAATFDLYRRADTDGVFHFETPGMKRHLRRMKPGCLEDLMMLDALFRPDALDLLPRAADLKNGDLTVPPTIPETAEILAETYGLTVYQEQVMLIAQRVAGFSPGQSDTLRKALCRRDGPALEHLGAEFIRGGLDKGFEEDSLGKVWDSWLPLGRVIFNKSHAVCYALLSYRTAWLKAHFRDEFEAADKKR